MKTTRNIFVLAAAVIAAAVVWGLATTRRQSVAVTVPLKSEWQDLSPGVGEPFRRVQFVDSDHGWGITTHSLWKTEDGGHSWLEVRRAPNEQVLRMKMQGILERIQFLNPREGWLLEGDHLLRTTNAGATWEQKDFKNVIVRSFRFLDQNTGWAVGERLFHPVRAGDVERWSGVIFATSDGGSTWHEVETPAYLGNSMDKNWRLLDVWPVSSKSIWVAGDLILHSDDGGRQWKEIHIQPRNEVYGNTVSVEFSDASLGWITTDQGNRYLLTSDGGVTWELRSAPTESLSFADLTYINAREAWGVGRGIYHSGDGGISWVRVGDGKYNSIEYVRRSNILLAAGDGVVSYKL